MKVCFWQTHAGQLAHNSHGKTDLLWIGFGFLYIFQPRKMVTEIFLKILHVYNLTMIAVPILAV